eukprot:3934531-Rhodomonas_salina.2
MLLGNRETGWTLEEEEVGSLPVTGTWFHLAVLVHRQSGGISIQVNVDGEQTNSIWRTRTASIAGMQQLHVSFSEHVQLTVPLDISCSDLLVHPRILDAAELHNIARGRPHDSDTARIAGVATYSADVPEYGCACPHATALGPDCEYQFAPAAPSCTSACAPVSPPVCTPACDANAECQAGGTCVCLPGYE